MPGPGYGGIDLRRSGSSILLEAFFLDANGNLVTSGTTNASIYQPQSDGTLWTYDWTYNCFRPTVQTATTTLTHRLSTGVTNTGIWTAAIPATSQANWTNRVWAASLRWQPNGNQYHIHLDSAGRLRIGTVVAGTFTTLQDANFTFLANRQYQVDARAVGVNPTTVSAVLWDVTSTPTIVTTNTVTDSTASLQTSGQSGVVADGFANANLTIPFSSVTTYANSSNWTQVVSDTFQRADSSPGAAASTTAVGNGWIDLLGGTWWLNFGSLFGLTYSNNNWQTALLARPTSENQQDQRLVFTTQLALNAYQFTRGNRYYLQVSNSNASPGTQTRAFQFGGSTGDDAGTFTAIQAQTGLLPTIGTQSSLIPGIQGQTNLLPAIQSQVNLIPAQPAAVGSAMTLSTGAVTNLVTSILTDATSGNQTALNSLGLLIAITNQAYLVGTVTAVTAANRFTVTLSNGATFPNGTTTQVNVLKFLSGSNKSAAQTIASCVPSAANVAATTFNLPFGAQPAVNDVVMLF